MHQLQTTLHNEEQIEVIFSIHVLIGLTNLFHFLRDYPYISSHSADSYMGEKDVVIIWISEEHGISLLAHQQILNFAVTRAKKCLLICGANLTTYKVNFHVADCSFHKTKLKINFFSS